MRRFVFTDGHSLYWIAVTITEEADGTAFLKVSGTERRTDYRAAEIHRRPIHARLSADEVNRLAELEAQAQAWEFETGSWDGSELYMHCQSLEMERMNAEGYRYSSVSIGCNKPEKLMPLVEEVVRLARLRTDGIRYY